MYSVIIQNQKTMDEFAKYQSLFMETINNDRIGICKWIESGTTIDTALPELAGLTNDKEEWRAVIVRFEDESAKAGFCSGRQNPYDFFVNRELDTEIVENPVPLVRLTHMLGGIPAPEMKFEPRQVIEANKAPRTVYEPVVDEEQNAAYERLKSKYKFDGKMPASILIVTVRENFAGEEDIGKAWLTHKESESSEFWKVNRYPSICRFLVCDFTDGGPVKRDGDEFNFWMSVLLLAMNEPDAGTLQAYRLYNLNTKVNKEMMTEAFQHLVNKLTSSRYVIEESIRQEARERLSTESKLPKYRMQIPVSIPVPKDSEIAVHKNAFGILSSGVAGDIANWSHQKQNSEKMLEDALRTTARTLDQTADRMREFSTYDEAEVSGLNKYQIEDLKRETDDIYSDLIKVQSRLPKSNVSDDEEMNEAAEEVRRYLRGRVVGRAAWIALLIALVTTVLTALPALFVILPEKTVDIAALTTAVACEVLFIFFIAFAVLTFQKRQLNKLIRRYNRHMKAAFNRITNNAAEYSRYMSDIVSHSRGHSYMNLSARKKHYNSGVDVLRYRHIRAINLFLDRIRAWSKAYYLKIDFEPVFVDENISVDVSVTPTESKMYTFEFGSSYPVEVNNSGMFIDAPFSFIEKLEIVREELYDDKHS